MTRRSWLRLMAAGVLVVWLCLFLHWDNTEKSMIRALLVETNGDSWTVGLLYQFPEASADSSEAKAAIRLCIGRAPSFLLPFLPPRKPCPSGRTGGSANIFWPGWIRCGRRCLPVKSCFSIDPTGGWRPGCSGEVFR